MLKLASGIFNYFVLIVVCLATIGVNINKLHCVQCKEVYLQIKVIPQEDNCACEHGCRCCCDEKKDCSSETDHSFLKLTDFSQAEKLQLSDAAFIMPLPCLTEPVDWVIIRSTKVITFKNIGSDAAPPLEMLCTYLI